MEETKNSLLEGINKEKYSITCPYCFHKFYHSSVMFRSDSFYRNVKEMENEFGYTETEIEMMGNAQERAKKLQEYRLREAYVPKPDKVYRDFWHKYSDVITEPKKRKINPGDPDPWDMPIVDRLKMKKLITDEDGFVVRCIDILGHESSSRICPKCHNPLPLSYGKKPVKMISIIGVTGSGKTVYISQLLKHIDEDVNKAGLSAFYLSSNESDFVEHNKVAKNVPLPDSTTPGTLSQPMFYDIVQSVNGFKNKEDTIVLYDIAGENCQTTTDENGITTSGAEKMIKFAPFVQNSNGIILLIDPKQLKFVEGDGDEKAPSEVLNTLHNVIAKEGHCKTPIAICISKSDQCASILPEIASDDVQCSDADISGLPKCEFDGRTYNQLQQGLTELMKKNANSVCQKLNTQYERYNFFALSAIGCEAGNNGPIYEPSPKRIEEPILWLFKQFGYIKSNAPVRVPFPSQKKIMVERKKSGLSGLLGGKEMVEETIDIRYEEDL